MRGLPARGAGRAGWTGSRGPARRHQGACPNLPACPRGRTGAPGRVADDRDRGVAPVRICTLSARAGQRRGPLASSVGVTSQGERRGPAGRGAGRVHCGPLGFPGGGMEEKSPPGHRSRPLHRPGPHKRIRSTTEEATFPDAAPGTFCTYRDRDQPREELCTVSYRPMSRMRRLRFKGLLDFLSGSCISVPGYCRLTDRA
ncbi:collagen alpha-2(I) chain-like [Panthera tigris]|uniref:collagen alpha-2(I) chain-like n=1 Tax=Panthera tigris TaxID=9694 RepID=UPI001C6FC4A3|nr:collagen alpha-2(I) chain-like [Panthera tigris]